MGQKLVFHCQSIIDNINNAIFPISYFLEEESFFTGHRFVNNDPDSRLFAVTSLWCDVGDSKDLEQNGERSHLLRLTAPHGIVMMLGCTLHIVQDVLLVCGWFYHQLYLQAVDVISAIDHALTAVL